MTWDGIWARTGWVSRTWNRVSREWHVGSPFASPHVASFSPVGARERCYRVPGAHRTVSHADPSRWASKSVNPYICRVSSPT